jgi:glyoxylase I family protein
LLKLAHIALSVSNINKSAHFYRKHFGFKLVKRYPHKEIGLTICVIKKNNISLELFEFKKMNPLPQYRKDLDNDLKTIGVKHFSFAVSDIEGEYKRLKKSGVHFATLLRTFDNGLKYFFIKDLDGVLVEIMEIK